MRNKSNIFVFIFLALLVFIFCGKLFQGYFEADEWGLFTLYLPLTKAPNGLLTSFLSTFIDNGAVSSGEHIIPIASTIFFLNTKLFGLTYAPYAFMSLLFHTINSFFVFCLMRMLLQKNSKSFYFALISSIFFALAPTPLHTITGAAPFYGENVLSVTFVLLCIIAFKFAYIKKAKKYLYLSIFFLFSALFSKETSGYLFLLLPFMILFEKRIFPLKFLGKLFIFCIIIYAFFRFLLPNIHSLPEYFDTWVGSSIPSTYKTPQPIKPVDTGTIVSRDLSIHKNLPAEILFRTVTFPVRMVGTVFVPRPTVFSIVQALTPIVVPLPSESDHTSQLSFLYGSGNYVVIYIIGIGILIFCITQVVHFFKKNLRDEAYALALGTAIIIFSALPLVVVVLTFPRWGYDFYFDSRYYYHPTIGAALVFPFLLIGFSEIIARSLKLKSAAFVGLALFIVWFIYNIYIFLFIFNQFVNRYNLDRKEVLAQIKNQLPTLPDKTVLYIETDGQSAYGSVLPFNTSVPQAITVAYYDKNPLPNSFFSKILFDGKPEGYKYSDKKGFGYYIYKKTLADELLAKKFSVDDIYAFYYEAKKVKLNDRTISTRNEMKKYLTDRKNLADWKVFVASPSATQTMRFLYPPDTEIVDNPIATSEATILKDVLMRNPQFTASIKVIHVAPTLDISEMTGIFGKMNNAELPMAKKVALDSYHFNDAFTSSISGTKYYLLKFDDLLFSFTTSTIDLSSIATIEKILGSLTVTK